MMKSLGYALLVSLGSLCLIGCPASSESDPQAAPGPAASPAGDTQPGPAAAPAEGGGTQGEAGSPPPVELDEDGAPIVDGSMIPAPGEGVVVSGTASYTGDKEGSIRVDIIRVAGGEGAGHQLMNTALTDDAGKWSFEVPKDVTAVTVVAYIDLNKDGPNPGEPTGLVEEVSVGADGATGIEIVLSEDAKGLHDPGKPAGGPGAPPPPPAQ